MSGTIYQGVIAGTNPVKGTVYQVKIVGGTIATTTMPTASEATLGNIFQYTGETDENYTQGYFYKGDRSVNTESTASASVKEGSTGTTAVSINKTTFEEEITATGEYAFIYDGQMWQLNGEDVDIANYGLTATTTSASASVKEGYETRLGTVSVDATTFASVIDETGEYTFTYDSGWKYDGEDVTLATYGITVPGADQFDVSGAELGATVTGATFKTAVENQEGIYDFVFIGKASKIIATDEVSGSHGTLTLVRDSDHDSGSAIAWLDGETSYYTNTDIIVGDEVIYSDTALETATDYTATVVTERSTTVGYWEANPQTHESISLATYGIAITETPSVDDMITVEYTHGAQAGDEFVIDFTIAGPHAGDEIDVDYTATVYDYFYTRIDVQPAGTPSKEIVDWDGSSVELASSKVYNAGTLASGTITLPASTDALFDTEINFTSGATPTSWTAPASLEFIGDDVVNGALVPTANANYSISISYSASEFYGVVLRH